MNYESSNNINFRSSINDSEIEDRIKSTFKFNFRSLNVFKSLDLDLVSDELNFKYNQFKSLIRELQNEPFFDFKNNRFNLFDVFFGINSTKKLKPKQNLFFSFSANIFSNIKIFNNKEENIDKHINRSVDDNKMTRKQLLIYWKNDFSLIPELNKLRKRFKYKATLEPVESSTTDSAALPYEYRKDYVYGENGEDDTFVVNRYNRKSDWHKNWAVIELQRENMYKLINKRLDLIYNAIIIYLVIYLNLTI